MKKTIIFIMSSVLILANIPFVFISEFGFINVVAIGLIAFMGYDMWKDAE